MVPGYRPLRHQAVPERVIEEWVVAGEVVRPGFDDVLRRVPERAGELLVPLEHRNFHVAQGDVRHQDYLGCR